MMTPAAALVISDGQREALEVIARSQTAPYRQLQRARVLLLAADGTANARIAAQVGITVSTVRAWRSRFSEDGLGKLGKVREGLGRKPAIPQDKIDEIVRLTQHSRPAGQTHWSCRTMAEQAGVSPATVQRVWAARGLKPHLVKTFKLSNDPRFEEKLIDVVGLSLNPPGQRGRAVPGREVLGAGVGPHPALAADGQGPSRDDDPRLQAQRHHHPVRGAGRAHRQSDRRLPAAAPAHRVPAVLRKIEREVPKGCKYT